eukprot:scaffold7657_cov269-Prasinococcus_capsulatus_cf.AAC.1
MSSRSPPSPSLATTGHGSSSAHATGSHSRRRGAQPIGRRDREWMAGPYPRPAAAETGVNSLPKLARRGH